MTRHRSPRAVQRGQGRFVKGGPVVRSAAAAAVVADALEPRRLLSATIKGSLFADNNANVRWDTGDVANIGWTVYLDQNRNGLLDGTEPTDITDHSGRFSFTVGRGTYVVRQAPRLGWRVTQPTNRDHHVVTVARDDMVSVAFGSTPIFAATARITGTLFADNNSNARWDAGDTRNANWRVYLDGNGNGRFDGATEISTLSDTQGTFTFNNVVPGSHVVRQVIETGWVRTQPAGSDALPVVASHGQTAAAGAFGNAPLPETVSKVQGNIFADLNSNGSWDAADGRHGGWTVYVDADNDGTLDASELSVSTDINGYFAFNGLVPGTYHVRQVLQPGWRRTVPATTDRWTANVAGGQTVTGAFGNAPLPGGARITGTLFNDGNANGAWDTGDTRLSAWRVYLDANNNAQCDPGEVSSLTGQWGEFVFPGLSAGTYTVRQVLGDGWRQTCPRPAGEGTSVTLAAGQSRAVALGATEAVSSISGSAFNDANGNGVRDTGEGPLAKWAVYVDSNNNRKDDYGERWVSTDAQGNFSFTGLPAGTYRIRFIDRYGWNVTAGVQSYVAIVTGRNSMGGYGFGARQLPEPDSYDANKIVSWFLIGGTTEVVEDRTVGWNIKADGWTGFVERYIQPQIEWGARRFMLHNPFGTVPGVAYEADQAIEAAEAGLHWLTADFVQAWLPITAQGIELIIYLGMPQNDPSFAGLSDLAWQARFNESMALPLAAGASIALDMSLRAVPGDRDWNAVQGLRDQGVRVYGEPRPSESLTHWHDAPLIAEDWIWKYTDPEINPNPAHWTAKDSQLTGEVVRLISRPPEGRTYDDQHLWAPTAIRSILREGHTAGVPLYVLIARGIRLNDLLTTTTT